MSKKFVKKISQKICQRIHQKNCQNIRKKIRKKFVKKIVKKSIKKFVKKFIKKVQPKEPTPSNTKVTKVNGLHFHFTIVVLRSSSNGELKNIYGSVIEKILISVFQLLCMKRKHIFLCRDHSTL